MKTTVKQVRKAMLKMNQDCSREINDGSGETGTITLRETISKDESFCICDNINQWINEKYNTDDYTHKWTEQDIRKYVDETYPEIKMETKQTNTNESEENGINQAKAQLSSIKRMIHDLEKAKTYAETDTAQQTIQEDALSVEVKTDWHAVGDTSFNNPTEYRILLCYGGPSVQVIGDLNEHSEPETAEIQYQDWFISWKTYTTTTEEKEILLNYARQFYYGE